MKRTWIIPLAVAVALAIALPAGAKKPEKSPKPGTGFKPIACTVDEDLGTATVQDIGVDVNGELIRLPPAPVTVPHTMWVLQPGVFWVTPYTVDPLSLDVSPGDVLCLQVELVEGTLSDLRVRWMDYFDNETGGSCGLFWVRGKELRSINAHDVFATGLSLANWTSSGGLCGANPDDNGGSMTVAVMPNAKSDPAKVKVTIGIDSGG